VNQIDLKSTSKKIVFEEEVIFLNFNYTLTLKEVYKIPYGMVFHIHGDVENNQGPLIFGHNEELTEMPEMDENGDSNGTMFTDSENVSKYPFYAFKKPVTEIISENKKFFENINSIEEVIILGHSFNTIDIPYFEEIVKKTKITTRWKVSYYKEEDKELHLGTLQEIEICNIELFNMNCLV